MTSYDRLLSQLDAFIRKYYANQLLRGGLLLLICVLAYLLTISVSEYFLFMPSWLRLALVAVFLLGGGISLILLVCIPALKMTRLGKRISHEQAAEIIGRHFPGISDKLLNILQLRKHPDTHASMELAEASIKQKADELVVFPISGAINLSGNRRYLRYLLPLFLIAVLILLAAPQVLLEGSGRLMQPGKTFERPAPFNFEITSQPLRTLKNRDFELRLTVSGSVIPDEVYIQRGQEQQPMTRTGAGSFRYTFRNPAADIPFRFAAAGFFSGMYELSVIPRPAISSLKLAITYPPYTGRADEVRGSIGDMTLPAGTYVQWMLATEHTDRAMIRFGEGEAVPMAALGATHNYRHRFMRDTTYTLLLDNRTSAYTDSLSYRVQVIPDQHPVLHTEEFRDTVTGKQVLLTGSAGDDYGISKVLFRYSVEDGSGREVRKGATPLEIRGGLTTPFRHYFDLEAYDLQPGQRFSYFIEAWDNDAVHGSKATRSATMYWQMYESGQLDSVLREETAQIRSGLGNSDAASNRLQSGYEEVRRKMLQTPGTSWEQEEQLKGLLDQQMQVKNQLEQVRKRFEEQSRNIRQQDYTEEIRDKQDAIQSQLENLLDKELQAQLDKLQELMRQLNKNNATRALEELQEENKLFRMDMERIQSLMQQLEMQMRMEDMARKMERLAERQEELRKQTLQAPPDAADQLKARQDSLAGELEQVMREDFREIEEKNSEMPRPQDVGQAGQSGKQAQQQMQQSSRSLQQGNNSKSAGAQEQAVKNMQEMAKAMQQMAGGMEMEQIEMDIRSVRQLLTNLMRLSFDQEKLMGSVQTTNPGSQAYLSNQREQNRLSRNAGMIRDSLFSLSKRLSKLSATVNRETAAMEKNMTQVAAALEERKRGAALTRQQYVMTHANNLALMLNEMLSNLMQMQQQGQQQQGQNSGSCSKPGGSNPKPGPGQQLSDIITRQQDLGNAMQQMEQARKQRGEGKTPGSDGSQGGAGESGRRSGDRPGEGEGESEQLARMVREQAALRRQLQEITMMLNSKKPGAGNQLRDIEQQMDRTETDLVNRRMSNELLMRQRQIMTRLLEAEKSLREQDEDNQRSSRTPEAISRPIPPELEKQAQKYRELVDYYHTAPPHLKPYYKKMVDTYYKAIGQ